MYPHILAHVNIIPGLQAYRIKKLYLGTDFGQILLRASSTRDNVLPDLTSIKMNGARLWVQTYSNGHMK